MNTLLVYSFLKKIGAQLFGFPSLKNAQIAFLAALLFSVSPVNLEAVAWVSASKVLLYALFYLLALLSYCKYIETGKQLFYYLTLILFVLSFGAKEQAVILPLGLLLMDYIYGRDFKLKVTGYEKAPFFVLAIWFGIITIESQGFNLIDNDNFYPVYQKVILSFYTASEYFTKIMIPVNLSYLYPFPFQVGESTPWWLWIYPLAIPLIIFCFYELMKKWMIVGLVFFVIHIILVINLFSIARFSIIADRYAYVSSIGLYLLIAYVSFGFLGQLKRKSYLTGMVLLYVFSFMLYTHLHSKVWSNANTLKEKMRRTIRSRTDYDQLTKP